MRKHHNIIVEWAKGKEVQRKNCYGNWIPCPYPTFKPEEEYRITPEVTTLYSRQALYFSKLNNSVHLFLLQSVSLESLENECQALERSDKDFLKWAGNIEKVEYVKPTSN